MSRQKPLRVRNVAGNAAINRSPLRKAIQSLNRSAKAAEKVRKMAKKRKR